MIQRNLLNRLKTSTQWQHYCVENQDHFKVLTSPRLTKNQYINAIELLYHPILSLESSLKAYIVTDESIRDIPYRSELLLTDLNNLHVKLDHKSLEKLDISNLPEFIGLAYVLEGFRLGSGLIYSNLVKCLPELDHLFFGSNFLGFSEFSKKFETFEDQIEPEDYFVAEYTANTAFEYFMKDKMWLYSSNS